MRETLCGMKHGSAPYLGKKKIISMPLFPLHLARNNENGNIESKS